MSNPQILDLDTVRRHLRKELAKRAAWPDVVGVRPASRLYPPPPRTPFDAAPAHFGFESTEAVRQAVRGVGTTMLSPQIMDGRRPLRPNDLLIPTFEPMAVRARLRLNGTVTRVAWRVAQLALGDTLNQAPDNFRMLAPPPAWEGPVAFGDFLGNLITRVREKLPDIADPVIPRAVEPSIRSASDNQGIRNLLLEKVLQPALKQRLQALENEGGGRP